MDIPTFQLSLAASSALSPLSFLELASEKGKVPQRKYVASNFFPVGPENVSQQQISACRS